MHRVDLVHFGVPRRAVFLDGFLDKRSGVLKRKIAVRFLRPIGSEAIVFIARVRADIVGVGQTERRIDRPLHLVGGQPVVLFVFR